VAEVTSKSDCEVEEVARAVARGLSPEPTAAPPGMSPKDTRDSEQYSASNPCI
jgi:hypothetical protein